MTLCHAMIGAFKSWRAGPTNALFLFHIISLLLIYQKDLMAQLAGVCACNPHDLGSSPRSTLSQYYFSSNVHMQLQGLRRIIHIPDQPSTCALRSSQWPRLKAHHGRRSTWL